MISNGATSPAAIKAASVAPRAWARGLGAAPAASPLVWCGCGCRALFAGTPIPVQCSGLDGSPSGKTAAGVAARARHGARDGRPRAGGDGANKPRCNQRPTKATSMDGPLFRARPWPWLWLQTLTLDKHTGVS